MAATPISAPDKPRFLSDGMPVVIAMAAALLVIHIIFNNRYDYFRDEFDYLACAKHLAWGYVDQPPLIPWLTRLSLMILGDSLRAIRFLPALAMSLTVVFTAVITRELGGRAFALICSAASVVASPFYLNNGAMVTTNYLEPLLWTGCAYFAILAASATSLGTGFGLASSPASACRRSTPSPFSDSASSSACSSPGSAVSSSISGSGSAAWSPSSSSCRILSGTFTTSFPSSN